MLRLVVRLDPFAALRRPPGGRTPDLGAVAHAAMLGGAGAARLTLGAEAEARDLRERLEGALLLDLPAGGDLGAGVEAALRVRPERVGLGLDGPGTLPTQLAAALERLAAAGLPSALRLPATEQALLAANEAGAAWVHLDTTPLAQAATEGLRLKEFLALKRCATTARLLGLRVSVGGGLGVGTLARVATLAEVEEAHVGFGALARAVFTGLTQAVRDLKADLHASADDTGTQDPGDDQGD